MKQAEWVHPNDAGYYIGTLLGEPPPHVRKNGKTILRGWVDQDLVDERDWPHSADGNEAPSARVNMDKVRTQVALRLAANVGQLAPDWDRLEVDLRAEVVERGLPERDNDGWQHLSDMIVWCRKWLGDRGQQAPSDRTIRRRIEEQWKIL